MRKPTAWMIKTLDGKRLMLYGEEQPPKFAEEVQAVPLYTAEHLHLAELTDVEIMEIFTAYEEMQEYGYVGKKPFNVHLGWSLKDINQCLMLARTILRKAQEK